MRKTRFKKWVACFLVAVFLLAIGPASAQDGGVRLEWDANTEDNLAGYHVYRLEGGAEQWELISGDQPIAEPTFSDTTRASGVNYRYGVTAVADDGSESAFSNLVSQIAVADPPNAPTALRVIIEIGGP